MRYNYDQNTLADIPLAGAREFPDAPALAMARAGKGDACKGDACKGDACKGDGAEVISYLELELYTRRTALDLAARGLEAGDRVAILSENRPEWGVASLGIARAGAVSVPILIDFPPEQIANIVEHSGAKFAFVSAKCARRLGERALSAVILPIEALCAPPAAPETDEERLAGLGALPKVRPEDLAAIVYTSGTTGRSKGVMLRHRNFVADALACESVIVLNKKDVLLSILPLAHTYEYTIGFVIPMMSGASVHYLDRPPTASALLPVLSSLRPSIMLSVPLVIEKIYRQAVKPSLEGMKAYKSPLFRPLIKRVAGAKLKRTFGGRMRFFGVGGAPLDPEVEDFLLAARFPYAIGYGLTETAPIIAAAKVGSTFTRMAGPPIGDAHIRISNADFPEGAPRGQEGEIQVRGAMVGPGYYLDPERTAEAFTADGWFRSGDLGYFDRKGRLFVRGRLKTMILGASGENIYPEEVEAVLNSSPYVLESLVYGDEEGLTALVQLKPEVVDELRDCLREGIQGAEKAAARFGQSVGAAIRRGLEQAEAASHSAEQGLQHAVGQLLARVKKETNEKLAAFSRIGKVELQDEAFEKTPTQKIKRFLYPKRNKAI